MGNIDRRNFLKTLSFSFGGLFILPIGNRFNFVTAEALEADLNTILTNTKNLESYTIPIEAYQQFPILRTDIAYQKRYFDDQYRSHFAANFSTFKGRIGMKFSDAYPSQLSDYALDRLVEYIYEIVYALHNTSGTDILFFPSQTLFDTLFAHYNDGMLFQKDISSLFQKSTGRHPFSVGTTYRTVPSYDQNSPADTGNVSYANAYTKLIQSGNFIVSSSQLKNKEDGSNPSPTRTCLHNLRSETIEGLLRLRSKITDTVGNIELIITGGTEGDGNVHKSGGYSHGNGYCIDLACRDFNLADFFKVYAYKEAEEEGNFYQKTINLGDRYFCDVAHHGAGVLGKHYHLKFYKK